MMVSSYFVAVAIGTAVGLTILGSMWASEKIGQYIDEQREIMIIERALELQDEADLERMREMEEDRLMHNQVGDPLLVADQRFMGESDG